MKYNIDHRYVSANRILYVLIGIGQITVVLYLSRSRWLLGGFFAVN